MKVIAIIPAAGLGTRMAVSARGKKPAASKQFTELGGTVLAASPADFGEFIADEIEKWARVIKFAGLKAD